MSGLYIIPILAVLILVHELGHYFAARWCGVKVEEFGIGIPPRLYGRERNGVIWSINAIPFGGFVRVKGEDAGDMSEDSMNSKPPIQRAFFLTAGVMMNLLLAILLMVAVVGFQGVPHSSVYIGNTPESVVAGSPAAKAGWLPGDRIVSVNGKTVETTTDVSEFTSSHRGEEVTFVIERGGNLIATQVTPRKNPPKGEGAVGVGLSNYTNGRVTVESVSPDSNAAAAGIQSGDVITEINGREVDDAFVVDTELRRFEGFSVPIIVDRDGLRLATSLAVPQLGQSDEPMESVGFATVKFKPLYEKVSALKVIPRGFQEAYETSVQMVKGLIDTFSNTDRLRDVSGPIGMGQATSEIVDQSSLPLWVTLAQISIVLSLNLAVLNLLPFPALDGGRLVFVIIEMLRGGRKIAPEKEGMVHFAGIVVLLGVMFVVAFSDIQRLVEGRSLIP